MPKTTIKLNLRHAAKPNFECLSAEMSLLMNVKKEPGIGREVHS